MELTPTKSSTTTMSRRMWQVVFYGPSVGFALASRVLALYRNYAQLAISGMIKGSIMGLFQDVAVFLQTLIIVHSIMSVYESSVWTLHEDTTPSARQLARILGIAIASLALTVAYLWMTLACAVDLSLVLSFLPRLNRSFVEMYLIFSNEFASSIQEVLTASKVAGIIFYIVSCLVWVMAVVSKRVDLPTFTIPYCETSAAPTTGLKTGPTPYNSPRPPLLVRVATSTLLRTCGLAVLAFVAAIHISISMDGVGSDIYLMSNAMFALETEEILRAPTRSHAAVRIDEIQGKGSSSRMAGVSVPEFMERTIGLNEVFEVPDLSHHKGQYPFWRKTLGYTGEKRFEFKENMTSSTRPPPTVLLINLESFRSLEVGVIGGREKMAKYNQTVTPFFDELSKSGVLFRQHYTPCVQTSRTILTSLFGILPSFTDKTALSSYPKTQFRLHGLPRILKTARDYHAAFWSSVNLAWDDWKGFLTKHGFDALYDDKTTIEFMPKEERDSLKPDYTYSWGRHDKVSFRALEYFLEARHKSENSTPLFMDIYSISAHDPYKLPSDFVPSANYSMYLTEDNTKYVNALHYTDQALEQLITGLRRKGLMNNTIILIEGDHGNGRMEHNDNPTMGSTHIYDEGSHIPMLIIADDLLQEQHKGMVVDAPTSQIDVLSTVADMLEIEGFMQHGMGRSMMRESGPHREVFLENPFDGKTTGIRTGELKYAYYGSGAYEVYNMTADPLEWSPIAKGQITELTMDDPVAEKHRFLELVMDITQYMYESDGFVPEQDPVMT